MPSTPLLIACLAELIGTALLILLGDGVVASVVLLNKQADWIVITTGWGLAVTFGVIVSGRLSGGHLNPAVTLALVVRGAFPRERLGAYWSAQVLGAFLGAVLVYQDYGAAFSQFEQKNGITRGELVNDRIAGPSEGGAGVFATYPAFDGVARNLLSEFLGTAVLLFGVRAITDKRNLGVHGAFEPVLVGALVWAIGLSLGGLTGYAINPARDFGPRLASMFLGWGPSVFVAHSYYFWVPIVAPLAGGVAGATLYDVAIGGHLHAHGSTVPGAESAEGSPPNS
jgi:glycerol uptake facilitator protein